MIICMIYNVTNRPNASSISQVIWQTVVEPAVELVEDQPQQLLPELRLQLQLEQPPGVEEEHEVCLFFSIFNMRYELLRKI